MTKKNRGPKAADVRSAVTRLQRELNSPEIAAFLREPICEGCDVNRATHQRRVRQYGGEDTVWVCDACDPGHEPIPVDSIPYFHVVSVFVNASGAFERRRCPACGVEGWGVIDHDDKPLGPTWWQRHWHEEH